MRILIVEDEKKINQSLANQLKENRYEVDLAYDGKKGLFLAETNDYCLMILDYNLPGINGYEVCKSIRKKNISLPILMITMKIEIENKVKMLDSGVDDYITKPFSFDEVMARIRAILRRPEIKESELIQIGDLVIDRNNFKVKRANKDIYLTRKEFMLLLYLAKNKNFVVSSEILLEHVWDINTDSFSKTVKTHIMNLRQKIDKNFEKKLIHTISCRGYMLSNKDK